MPSFQDSPSSIHRFASALLAVAALLLPASSPAQRGTQTTVDPSAITGADESVFATLDVTVHVDPVIGDDTRDGLAPSGAVRTLKRAGELAMQHNAAGESVRLLLADGEYRSADDFLDLPAGGTDRPIVVEAATIGGAVLVGSEVWTGWEIDANGNYYAPWTNAWGLTRESWVPGWARPRSEGGQFVDTIGLRREMVLVDGEVLYPRSSYAALTRTNPLNGRGSFFVDEANQRIYLRMPSTTSPANHTIEVAVRPATLRDAAGRPESPIFIERGNVALRGLVVKHFAMGVREAVSLRGGDNLLVEDCDFSANNWYGLGLTFGVYRDVTIRRTTANENGMKGFSGGGRGMKNVVVEYCQTDRNNWRGEAGGTTGFASGGIKFSLLHDGEFFRNTASYNRASGFWNDLDCSNVIFDQCVATHNSRFGIDLEASQGPFLVLHGKFIDNTSWQITCGASANVTIASTIAYMTNAQTGVSEVQRKGILTVWQETRPRPDQGRYFNWETGEELVHTPRNWTVIGSSFRGVDTRLYNRWGVGAGGDPAWPTWLSTLYSNNNRFYKVAAPQNEAFDNPNNGRISFEAWQTLTGQDLDSVWVDFEPVILPVAPENLMADALAARSVALSWTDPSNLELSVEVERRLAGSIAWDVIAVLPENATGYVDTTVDPLTAYEYRVAGVNADGRSLSNEVAVTTPDGIPNHPTGLVATALAPDSVVLAWEDRSNNETGFIIERREQVTAPPKAGASAAQFAWTEAGLVNADVTGFVDSPVEPGKTYRYRVRAVNALGRSDPSEQASVVTASP